MFGRHEEIIGIDLGSAAAKAVVLRRKKGSNALTARGHAVVAAEPGGNRNALEVTLRRLFRKLRARARDCAVAIWPDGAKFRLFDRGNAEGTGSLGRMKPTELARLFPEELAGYVSAFATVESCRETEASSVCVAEAVPKQIVDDLEAVLRKLGRRLRVVQLTPMALLNAFTASCQEIARDEPYLVADFGLKRTLIVAGYHGLTRAARVVDFPWETIITTGKESELKTAEGMESMQMLLRELVDVCDYLDTQDQHTRLNKMHVSGELSRNAEVMRTLGEALEVTCIPWNPLQSVAAAGRGAQDSALTEDLSRLPLAAGVALQYAA